LAKSANYITILQAFFNTIGGYRPFAVTAANGEIAPIPVVRISEEDFVGF
jgi:hypothetical protein